MLGEQLAAALRRREALGTRRHLLLGDADTAARFEKCADFSSNDYLSIARSSEGRAGLVERITAQRLAMGSTGSRLLDGDSAQHTQMEARIARHFHGESALLFNSGYDANVSLLTTLPQPGDVVVYDALVHASMHDGMRASRAMACRSFGHNDPRDLDRVLGSMAREGNVFLALESVYSMDGTVCCLDELIAVLQKHVPYERQCVLVDEAHAVGVYGAKGSGLVAALGRYDDVAVRLVTFGKALGCAGAAVLCPPLWREYLLNYARPLIYSTSLAPPSVAAIDAVLDILDKDSVRQDVVHARTRRMYSALGRHAPPHGRVPASPIVPYRTPHAKAMAAFLQEQGFLVRGVCYPTVPRGEERVRICIHTHNTDAEIDALAAAIAQWNAKRAVL